MSMVSEALTVGVWHELTDLDDDNAVQFYLDTSDTVFAAFSASEPDDSTPGDFCVQGMNSFQLLFGRKCWLKLFSGSANVIYSQFGGLLIDEELSVSAFTDGGSTDKNQAGLVVAGFDEPNSMTYVGLIHTKPGGFVRTQTVSAATLFLNLAGNAKGRTFTLSGIAETSSITAGLTDYDSLASGQTLTTETVSFTVGTSGQSSVDVTSIVDELVNLTGWTAASPMQFHLVDAGTAETGRNTTLAVLTGGKTSVLFARKGLPILEAEEEAS